MNLLAADLGPVHLSVRLSWEGHEATAVAGSDPWLRASRRVAGEVRDEHKRRIPLRDEVWLMVYPPRAEGVWRCEAEAIGPDVVGRGPGPDQAAADWRVRFSAVVQRFLEMRPFEMTDVDRELWARIQAVVDVAAYKAAKPMVVRQVGRVAKARTGVTLVVWEDGARERVKPAVFDEAFAAYSVGQRFEATVTRNPVTFKLLRATAVRKLSEECRPPLAKAMALWDRVVCTTAPTSPGVDEEFWLKPAE